MKDFGVYPIAANLLLLPLGLLSYTRGLGLGLLAAAACIGLALYYTFYIDKVDVISVIPMFAAFISTPVILDAVRRINNNAESIMKEALQKAEREIEIIKDKEERLSTEVKEFDAKVSEIVNLYDITREMSATLLFSDIFQIFSEFLQKYFKFISCKLILMAQTQEEPRVEKVYKIEGASPGVVPAELIDNEILKEVIRSKKVISCEDFIAIPLIAQDKIIGVLNVEGLDEAALERFLIVARQFGFEIEKVQLYETVQRLAITDGLTKVFVRRHFMERFNEEFERSVRHNFRLSLLMIDLDYFKEYNDRFGHLLGDAMLREVAAVLKQNIREIDLLGRYGGEEFSILLPETVKDGALLVGERIRLAVENKSFKVYDEVLKATISVGVATFPDDAAALADLMERADEALYKAKEQGRNRVVSKGKGD